MPQATGIDATKRTKDLTEEEVARLSDAIQKVSLHPVHQGWLETAAAPVGCISASALCWRFAGTDPAPGPAHQHTLHITV